MMIFLLIGIMNYEFRNCQADTVGTYIYGVGSLAVLQMVRNSGILVRPSQTPPEGCDIGRGGMGRLRYWSALSLLSETFRTVVGGDGPVMGGNEGRNSHSGGLSKKVSARCRTRSHRLRTPVARRVCSRFRNRLVAGRGTATIRRSQPLENVVVATAGRHRSRSDEHYLIDICDRVLAKTALRQHRFDFLLGDPGKIGRQAKLPVDAYYPDILLVVEIMERQHSHDVQFFDHRLTVSGMARGQQRRLYDQRRQTLLPQHGLRLICLETRDFTLRGHRLRRDLEADEAIVRCKLAPFLPEAP